MRFQTFTAGCMKVSFTEIRKIRADLEKNKLNQCLDICINLLGLPTKYEDWVSSTIEVNFSHSFGG